MANSRGNFLTIGLLLTLIASGQAHLNIFLNLHEVLRLIGKLAGKFSKLKSLHGFSINWPII